MVIFNSFWRNYKLNVIYKLLKSLKKENSRILLVHVTNPKKHRLNGEIRRPHVAFILKIDWLSLNKLKRKHFFFIIKEKKIAFLLTYILWKNTSYLRSLAKEIVHCMTVKVCPLPVIMCPRDQAIFCAIDGVTVWLIWRPVGEGHRLFYVIPYKLSFLYFISSPKPYMVFAV